MKKNIISTSMFIVLAIYGHAQLGQVLKQQVKDSVNNHAQNNANVGINKTLSGIENGIGGLFHKKKKNKQVDTVSVANSQVKSDITNSAADGPGNIPSSSNNLANTTNNNTSNGNLNCKIDGSFWKDNNAMATLTGTSVLNIATDDNKTEAISIILSGSKNIHEGTFAFNAPAAGSYTSPSGESYGTKKGSLIITNYKAPSGKTRGWVEGSFSGTFNYDTKTKHEISAGTFSMPVRNLYE